MEIELLRSELERLFELEELVRFTRNVLGVDPEAVGGTTGKGSLARALTDHCVEGDAIEALCDALFVEKPETDPRLEAVRARGLRFQDEELVPGAELGPFVIEKKLGEGSAGFVYSARKGDVVYRLKVLRRECSRDRRSLNRFLTLVRLTTDIEHASLPKGTEALVADGRHFVVHEFADAQPLSARIGRTGPMHVNEARPILSAILDALSALHSRRIAHGNLKLENVLVSRDVGGAVRVLLVDACGDRLQARAAANGRAEPMVVSSPKTVSPEQIRGEAATERSDLYSFGAVAFEVLTGKPPFEATSTMDAVVAHLTSPVGAPSTVAPHGWVTKELDQLVLSLLEKRPEKRPAGAASVRGALEALFRPPEVEPQVSFEQLEELLEKVVSEPRNEDAALALDLTAGLGGDPQRIAEAFLIAASSIEADNDDDRRIKKALIHRAARIHLETPSGFEPAEYAYTTILEIDPSDETALAKLEYLHRQLGKWDDVIESLLRKAEHADNGTSRAEAMAQIGDIYAGDLDDKEQALVAFTQAFCEDPQVDAYAMRIEQLAGTSTEAWGEVLGTCTEASTQDLPPEAKNPLFLRMGRWYGQHYARPDLSLSCFQAVLATDPANDAALEGMTLLYRRAHQWSELAATLLHRARASRDAAKARDLRAEAAQVLEHHLSDTSAAQTTYAEILAEDPGHAGAAEALMRLYERTSDFGNLVKLLDRRVEMLRGEDRLRAMCRAAEYYEDRLNDDLEAVRRFDAVLSEDAAHPEALRGLDRLYSKLGRFKSLLENLETQVALATTPRQKIALYERIAGLYEEEFLDPVRAAAALEALLSLDADHDSALTSLSRHYRTQKRWEDLVAILERHYDVTTDGARRAALSLSRAKVLTEELGATERAIAAYERVLEHSPEHAGALESLAQLRETAGHEGAAVAAIEALADKAAAGEARAEQYVRAAKLLEARGDRDGAIERYKRALDENPNDAAIALALRGAYVARGDANAAVELIERELERTAGEVQKAKLSAEMASLHLLKLSDEARAERAAKRAIDYDPTNIEALMLLGDLAFDGARFVEASAAYEKLANRCDGLPRNDAVRLLVRYVDALSKSGSTEKALAPMDTLLRLAPEDAEAVRRVASVTFEHGSPKRAVELYTILLEKLHDQLDQNGKALATYRMGEALRRSNDLGRAVTVLEEAADLNPTSPLPLLALTQTHEAKEDWEKVVDVKTRHLDLVEGEERVRLLIEIGELAATKLSDRTLATKSFVTALDVQPDDRKLLMRLMQLYSEDKDWSKLIDVVLKLADFVDDKKQRAKYLQTAAIVAGRELGEYDRALEFHARVRDHDPTNEKSIDETIELLKLKSDYTAAVEVLKEKAKSASAEKNSERMLEAFTELGSLYQHHLGRIGHAIDAYEAAQTVDPNNRERNELLAQLYASDPEKYLVKAVAAQMTMLRKNPFREESYKLLRRLYTEAQRADPAWCLCQALYVLKLSEPDEERFFRRMRSEEPAYAKAILSEESWVNCLVHADADTALTSIFALVEPAIIAHRGATFDTLGYDPRYAVEPAHHPYALSRTLHYAAGVLGMDLPPVFENFDDTGGLSFLHAETPSIVLGNAALAADIPTQAAAFIAARHLTYYRPGFYTRHLIPTLTGLRAWLFAAIKMNAPQFPVAPDIEGPVREAMAAIEAHLSRDARDHLARVVSKLLVSGRALDLKKWLGGVDLTADRVGFVLSHDLETAVEIIRASDDSAASVASQPRLRELVLFAISEPYFLIRETLGITVET